MWLCMVKAIAAKRMLAVELRAREKEEENKNHL